MGSHVIWPSANRTMGFVVGEACRWLLEQCSAAESSSEWEGMILSDSQYAYGVATRLFNPETNLNLATTVASLADSIHARMKLEFTHVRGRAARRRPAAAMHPCPTCQKEFLHQHTDTCRCLGNANFTCLFCPKVFQAIQARKNHERYSHSEEALAQGLIGAIPKRATKPRER